MITQRKCKHGKPLMKDYICGDCCREIIGKITEVLGTDIK